MEKVTVVTSFFKLKKSKHSIEEYKSWISNFCKLNCNLIVFTDVEFVINYLEDLYPINKVKIIKKDFYSFDMTSPDMMKFWEKQHNLDFNNWKSIHNPELYAVWAIKQECVMNAIKLNFFNTEYFIWCDIGILRNKNEINYYLDFPILLPDICSDSRICFLEVNKIPEHFVNLYKNYKKLTDFNIPFEAIGGGCIGGNIEAWLDFSEAYKNKLKRFEILNWFAGRDENIYFTMLIERDTKKPFKIFHTCNTVDKWMTFPAIIGGKLPLTIDERFE